MKKKSVRYSVTFLIMLLLGVSVFSSIAVEIFLSNTSEYTILRQHAMGILHDTGMIASDLPDDKVKVQLNELYSQTETTVDFAIYRGSEIYYTNADSELTSGYVINDFTVEPNTYSIRYRLSDRIIDDSVTSELRMFNLITRYRFVPHILSGVLLLGLIIVLPKTIEMVGVRADGTYAITFLDRIPIEFLLLNTILFLRPSEVPWILGLLMLPYTIRTLIVRYKSKTLYKYSLLCKVAQLVDYALGNGIGIIVGGIIGFVLILMISPSMNGMQKGIAFLLYLLLFLALGYWWMRNDMDLKELSQMTQSIRFGSLSPSTYKYFSKKIGRIGANMSEIEVGIKHAVEQQLTSERMKTELITNVSHDLKTPLTSISNYIDLLGRESLSERQQEYLEVLRKQSNRLNKLTDDLFVAAKVVSGDVALQLEPTDLVVFWEQSLGEVEENFANAQLEIVENHDVESVEVIADGKQLWRVLDNLLKNCLNYSLEHSRIYVEITKEDQSGVISIKNVSREILNLRSEELLERFVRGDSSRNTEGSGLGLSIARDLMEAMGGILKLETEGDLFKVTLKLPLYKTT